MQTFVVLVTCASQDEADTMAETVVGERLAACVNIVQGIRSVYRWEGAVEKGSELLLLIKTTQEKLAPLEERIKSLHGYSVPEFITLPISGGSADYLGWLRESVNA